MKKNDRQSITFIEDKKVYRLHRDNAELTVEIDLLMELDLNEADWANDAWVLDEIVAVRLNDTDFHFFMEPLV